MEEKVELVDFTKVYGHGKNSSIGCSNINFEAAHGQITGLLGPNGAGKSTMLKALCASHYATSGTVKVYGETEPHAIREMTGFVPEFPQLDSTMTVWETLAFECSIRGVKKEEIDSHVEKAIKICELESVQYQKVGTLSKGYLQRTSFAKAACFDSKLLILDEFSGGLDPAQIVGMRKTIKNLAKNRTVILSTHHIDEAVSLCDKIYIISNGSVSCSGTIDEVVKMSGRKSLEEAFLYFTAAGDSK